ncbi:MAG: phage major capsid protein [Candidatus Paceibacterota bacterium]
MFRSLMKAKLTEQEALVNAAMAESRAMTEDEQTKFCALQTEIEELHKTVEAAEKLAAQQAALDKPVNTPIYAQPKNPDDAKPFKTFGEQMLAIVRAGRPGGEIDPRLMRIQAAASGGANEGVPSEGGYLVQQDFSSELLRNVYQTGVLAPRCRRMVISANSNSLRINGIDETNRGDGYRWGGVQGYWAAEAATVTAKKPKFRKIELNLNKLMALYYSTDELLADASAMESILMQAFTEEIQFKLDDAIIRGDGSGKPVGILSADCLISQAAESGQAADTVLFENIVNMWSRLIAPSRANAVWLINQEIEPQLFGMVLSAGTAGVPVYMPAGGISGQQYGTLFARPVVPIEHCAKLGDLGDIILADFSQYILADKGGMQAASSIHVQFLYDETAFRITYRVDGQPVMASAITPYKATSGRTLSSFVALAAR